MNLVTAIVCLLEFKRDGKMVKGTYGLVPEEPRARWIIEQGAGDADEHLEWMIDLLMEKVRNPTRTDRLLDISCEINSN